MNFFNHSILRNSLLALIFLTCCIKPLTAETTSFPQNKQEAAREKLLMLFSGEWVSRSLYVATKLGIPDHLTTPKSIEELANLTGSDAESLYRLMHMLAGFDVFEELFPRVFGNTTTSELLVKTNPDTLHSVSIFYGEEMHESWNELLDCVKTGIPGFELKYKMPVFSYYKENPLRAVLFQAAMKEKTRAVVKSAIESYPFKKLNSVYDIGGGHGQLMHALLAAYPHLSGVIFDLPEVIEKNIQNDQSNENSRLKYSAGDFFKSIPEGGDAYLMKSVLHDWNDEKAIHILKNCHQAMRSDSKLLIIDVVLQEKNKSIYANCMDVLMLTVTGGKERSIESFSEIFETTGFVIENIYPTTTEFSILEVRKK